MNLTEFYPTPTTLSDKMLDSLDLKYIKTILEPSAGTGNLIEAVEAKAKSANYRYYGKDNFDIDAIEIDSELRHILAGKEYRVISDNFLTFDSLKKYDLILMNPPFSNGDEHLLKALELQKGGGQIICLLNAETLKNPYTNKRADLVRKLADLQAEIQYMDGEFTNAERKTNVEIALIKVSIPQNYRGNIILEELELHKAKTYSEKIHQENALIHGDFISGMIDSFNYEAKAGVILIEEFNSIRHLLLDSIDNQYRKPIIELKVDCNGDTEINAYLKKIAV